MQMLQVYHCQRSQETLGFASKNSLVKTFIHAVLQNTDIDFFRP